jgi:Ca-activated chloride channel family protein
MRTRARWRGASSVRADGPAASLVAAVVGLVLACFRPAAGQQALRDRHPFHTGVEITSLTATVTDADGHLVTGLPREAFEVFEDGRPQQVTQFTNERVPIGLGLLLDISDSMFGRRLADARTAVEHFLFDLLKPEDEYFALAFNHKPHVLTAWTHVPDVIRDALAALRPSGGTAIYDAVLTALPVMARRTRQRAAILVISDGEDTASTATLRDVRTALLRSDTFAYAIAIDPPGGPAINTRVNPEALREFTSETGGRTEVARTPAELMAACERIAEELNSQYVLGYSPPHGADEQFHSIRVRVRKGEYHVRARNGYVALPVVHEIKDERAIRVPLSAPDGPPPGPDRAAGTFRRRGSSSRPADAWRAGRAGAPARPPATRP